MKKLVLVLALVMAYGVSISNASTKVITVEKAKVTVVADSDEFSSAVKEEEKKKTVKKDAKACAGSTTDAAKPACGTKAVGEKPSTGCSDAAKKSCAASGKTCGDEKATTEKAAAKSCCGEKK